MLDARDLELLSGMFTPLYNEMKKMYTDSGRRLHP